MRATLLFLLPVLATSALAQPDPYPDIRVNRATVLPAEPTTADTLTVTYTFMAPGTCTYIRDWQRHRCATATECACHPATEFQVLRGQAGEAHGNPDHTTAPRR